MLVSHSVNLNELAPVPAVGIKQTMEPVAGKPGKFTRQCFIGNQKIEEPVKLDVYGRFNPYARHAFKIEAGQVVYRNDASDSQPEWKQVFAGESKLCVDYVNKQCTRIHLRRVI